MKLKRWIFVVIGFCLTVLLLAACSGTGSNGTVNVTVSLSEFKIESSITTFKVGVPYHFEITNNGTVTHEFMIAPVPPQGSGSTSPTPVPLAMVDASQLQPGQTATLDYTFTQTADAGTLEFACHLPGHYEAGMHTPIIVTN
jgi:uncharacterized cupredoxin-like copper-binding protein